jgi:hypothetical protein
MVEGMVPKAVDLKRRYRIFGKGQKDRNPPPPPSTPMGARVDTSSQ